jgi:UDP-N-acetylmuramyl pentapeptide phosphotransferase/UDP-N-acetylglucosamine-1-phosphate transferase
MTGSILTHILGSTAGSAEVAARALAALVLTAALCPVAMSVLRRRNVIDSPNSRSSHLVPTVRGGGIAPAIACLLVLATTGAVDRSEVLGVLLVATLMGGIGFADDVLDGLPVMGRLVGIAAVALAGAVTIVQDWDRGWLVRFGIVLVGSFVIVGFVNAFNFMDGINGISALSAAAMGAVYLAAGLAGDAPIVAMVGAVAAAAALGFLPFNAPVARVFLGDAGSYFFGGLLAALALLVLREGLPLDVAVAPMAVYLGDTAWTLVRRVRAGERWSEAHRTHAYQRLIAMGWSHMAVALLVGGLTLACGLLGLVSLGGDVVLRGLAALAVGTMVTAYLVLPDRLTHRHLTGADV